MLGVGTGLSHGAASLSHVCYQHEGAYSVPGPACAAAPAGLSPARGFFFLPFVPSIPYNSLARSLILLHITMVVFFELSAPFFFYPLFLEDIPPLPPVPPV